MDAVLELRGNGGKVYETERAQVVPCKLTLRSGSSRGTRTLTGTRGKNRGKGGGAQVPTRGKETLRKKLPNSE